MAKAIAESDTLITEIPDGDPQAQAAAFLKLARATGLPPIAERVPPASARRWRGGGGGGRAGGGAGPDDDLGGGAGADQRGGARGRRDARGRAGSGAGDRRSRASGARVRDVRGAARRCSRALPEAAQVKLLVAAIEGARDPGAEYSRLLTAWRSGDTAAIAADVRAGFRGAPELEAALVTARNRAWADDLKRARGKTRQMLVAVGAGHLVGNGGLPALLSARGFRVARMQ